MKRKDPLDDDMKYKIVHNLQDFRNATAFQSNVIYYLSGLRLEQEEMNALRSSFVKIDADGDGYITIDEAA